MRTVELQSWSQFTEEIKKIREEFGYHKIESYVQKNLILFRGQSDAEWNLKTTLERYSRVNWSVRTYAGLGLRCAPQIESFTNRTWKLPSYQGLDAELNENFDEILPHIPFKHFWVYLRHHSFPSPLLDWSISPYIAAFFAFADSYQAEKVAIFAYIERPKGTKAGSLGGAKIMVLGPYTRSHQRHFLQQSSYTICTRPSGKNHEIVCHEDIFESEEPDQDVLIKIIIPRSDRIKALSELHDHNINAFSLIQSEDSLMKTLAFNELEVKEIL